jgi:D-alanyl-D-alanine carboxypeptidase
MIPIVKAIRCHVRTLILTGAVAWASTVAVIPAHAQGRDRTRIREIVDSLAQEALATGDVAGISVAVVRGRDTLVLRGYGRANLELDVPTPQRAVYEIASEGKSFTAAAVLQLAEQGRLSLDDPLAKHLPGFDVANPHITLRHLLYHTSGLRDFVRIPEFFAVERQALPRDTLLRLVEAQPTDFEPGQHQFYSNTGYVLLSHTVEHVAGMPFEQYVEQNLLARAGMWDSRVSHNTELVPRLTSGYIVGQEGMQPGLYYDKRWPLGAGELRSTPGDMVAWVRALHGGQILGPAAYRTLTTPGELSDGTPLRYAGGFTVDSILGYRAFVTSGGTHAGYLSSTVYLPDDSVTVVLQMNTQGPIGPRELIASVVRAMLGDRSARPQPFRGRAADYVGDYHAPEFFEYQVVTIATDSAGRLTLSVDGSRAYPLAYRGSATFNVEPGLDVTFVRQGTAVPRLRWNGGTTNVLLERQPADAAARKQDSRPGMTLVGGSGT